MPVSAESVCTLANVGSEGGMQSAWMNLYVSWGDMHCAVAQCISRWVGKILLYEMGVLS